MTVIDKTVKHKNYNIYKTFIILLSEGILTCDFSTISYIWSVFEPQFLQVNTSTSNSNISTKSQKNYDTLLYSVIILL